MHQTTFQPCNTNDGRRRWRRPAEQIEALRLVLRGKRVAQVEKIFEKIGSRHHGHVHAVLTAVRRLGLDSFISSKPCRERDIVVGVLVARICEPDSKLAMTRWWKDTTLPDLLGLGDVDEDDIYAAMDWLLGRQKRIEKKLAQRHLAEGDLVLYDLTSSYFEGETCPLAQRGKSRDRKKETLQVNYGLVADRGGCPVAVSVFAGDTGDSTTLLGQAERVRTQFGIGKLVLVGDRGMISQKQIDVLRQTDGIDWITALKSGGIHKLVQGGALQLDLFDERNLFELVHEDFPGERPPHPSTRGGKDGHWTKTYGKIKPLSSPFRRLSFPQWTRRPSNHGGTEGAGQPGGDQPARFAPRGDIASPCDFHR